ncbi:MAG TPA: hypothetical protein VNQ77_16430 [Frankiaceae bacterium]|nr:hypothetical protein [Frankiaceae bacterium]
MSTTVLSPDRPATVLPPAAARGAWSPGHVAAAVALPFWVAVSVGGLFADGFYPDGPWAREAFRGSDLATLLVGVPVLVASLALSLRGSPRARLVLLGMLAYGTYDYSYYAFGAELSDWLLLHLGAFVASLAGLVLVAYELDVGSLTRRAVPRGTRRLVGAYLCAVGGAMTFLWVSASVRYALFDELLGDAPKAGQHLVFAIDLTLLVPGLVAAGVLLWRGAAWGVPAAIAMNVLAAVYQVALMAAAGFQTEAGVIDAGWFSPASVAIAAVSVASLVVLLRAVRGAREHPVRHGRS